MEYEHIIYRKENSIARIILNQPEVLNALWGKLMHELSAALEEAENDTSVKVVIIAGAGRAFASGADIKPYMAELAGGITSIPDRHRVQEQATRLLRIWDLRKPVIAQVHGYCLAGGLDLAMMCDIIIATRDTQFGRPEARTMGVGTMLSVTPWLIGMAKAKEMAFTGDMISGEEAERLGLINKAVAQDMLEETVNKIAEKMAKMPTDLLALQKIALNRSFELIGFRAAIMSCTDFDVIGHYTETAQRFAKMVCEKGVKEALHEANAPFSE